LRRTAQENHQPATESVKGAGGAGALSKAGWGAQRVPLKAAGAAGNNANSPHEAGRAESSVMDVDAARGETSHAAGTPLAGTREPEEQVGLISEPFPFPPPPSCTHVDKSTW
jgi:hypothetical protein